MHWAPIEWATPSLKAEAERRAPKIGEYSALVMYAEGSDKKIARYVVDYQNATGGIIYLRLPEDLH